MKLKIFQRNGRKNLSFCYNLTQPYSKCIYCIFVEYTRHRLEIIPVLILRIKQNAQGVKSFENSTFLSSTVKITIIAIWVFDMQDDSTYRAEMEQKGKIAFSAI